MKITKKLQIDGVDVEKLKFKIGIYNVYRQVSKTKRDAVLYVACGGSVVSVLTIEPNYECEESWVGDISHKGTGY